MTDALTESSRAERQRRLHEEFLDAILAYFKIPFPDMLDAVGKAYARCIAHEPAETLHGRATQLSRMLRLMREQDERTWANFIWHDIGLDDTRRLHKFREYSPFKDCSFVAYDSDLQGKDVRVLGQVAEFFSAMRENVLVDTCKFVVARPYGRTITLLALHPELLR